MKILKFKSFILEKHGTAEASLIFIPFLTKKISEDFLSFELSGNKELISVEKVNFSDLEEYINDDNLELYYKFPVVGIDIDYQFYKYSDIDFKKYFPTSSTLSPLTIGGGAKNFGNKNWKEYSRLSKPRLGSPEGIIIYLYIEIHFNGDIFDNSNNDHIDKLNYEIESTLYHEMNHFYEMYHKTKSGKPFSTIRDRGYLNTSLTGSSEDIKGFPKEVIRYWGDNFLFYVYLSEDFELRSHVQEMDFYFKKNPKLSLSDNRIFKYYDDMSKFDGDKFYQKMMEVINNSMNLEGLEADYIIEKIKNKWIKSYSDENSQYSEKPILPIKTLESMNGYEFIKWWEVIFNEKGDYVKKKIYKLLSNYR